MRHIALQHRSPTETPLELAQHSRVVEIVPRFPQGKIIARVQAGCVSPSDVEWC